MMIFMENEQKFKISLTGGDMAITDKEISSEMGARIIQILFGLPANIPTVTHTATVVENGGTQIVRTNTDVAGVDAKQFMASKQPKSDMERITCLAYYLNHNRGTNTFKTVELTHLNTEAAQPRFSNASVTARNAVAQQYLAPAGGGKKQITQRGEALVDALPDRSAVIDALEKNPMHGRKKTSAKKPKEIKAKKK